MKETSTIPVVAAALLTVHVGLVAYGAYIHFPTRNEVAHVPAGLAIWTNGSFELYRVNPPLPRALASLLVLAARPNTEMIQPLGAVDVRDEWRTAREFANGNPLRYVYLMRLSRVAGIGWSLAGAWLVWRWASELYGRRAGLLGLTIWCLGPTVNAHAQMATPDLPAAVAGLAAGYAFHRYLNEPTLSRALAAGLVLGVAQLCKFTLLVLYPAFAALVIVFAWSSDAVPYQNVAAWRKLTHVLAIAAASLLVINLGYLGRGSFTPLGDYSFNSRLLTESIAPDRPRGDNRFRGTLLGLLPVPVPYDFLSGMDLQRVDFEGRLRSYLRGEFSERGWWYYYLYALAVKTPLGILGLVALGMVLTLASLRTSEVELWLPALAILVLVSSQTGYTAHSRYVLPALPFVVVATAKVGRLIAGQTRLAGGLVLGLLGFAVVSSLHAYPHTLSYFNEAIGGPDQGWRHLADSNIDWGQDLLLLKEWAIRHPQAKPLYIAYDNFIDFRHVGYEWVQMPSVPPDFDGSVIACNPEAYADCGPRPGYFAVDIHNLIEGRGRFLRDFSPVAKVGYSIHIYRFDTDSAEEARAALGLPSLSQPRLIASARVDNGTTKDDRELQGEWQALEGAWNGENVPGSAGVESVRIIFRDDQLTIQGAWWGKLDKMKFRLDPRVSPKAIDLTWLEGDSKGQTVAGIYALEHNQLKLCLPIRAANKSKLPIAFQTEDGDRLVLVVLGRWKPNEPARATAQTEFAAIRHDWFEAEQAANEAIKKARTPAERLKARTEYAPKPAPFAERCLQLAEARGETQSGLAALWWAISNAPDCPASAKALALLRGGRLAIATTGDLAKALDLGQVSQSVSETTPPSSMVKKLAPLVLARVERDLDHPKAAWLLTWVCGNYWHDESQKPPRTFTQAADLIAGRFAESADIANFCECLGSAANQPLWAGKFEQHLRTILAKNRNRYVHTTALYALAWSVQSQGFSRQDEAEKIYRQFVSEYYGHVAQSEAYIETLLQLANDEIAGIKFRGLGRKVPEIEGEDLDGRPMKLSEFRGKVLLVSFWATWCVPCMQLVPHERSLLERLKSKSFAIIGVNLDGPAAWKKMLTNNPVTWRSFKNKLGDKLSIKDAWKVQGLPTLFLVDHKGIIRQRWLGNPGTEVLDGEIERLLGAALRDQSK